MKEQEICKACGGHGSFVKTIILNKDYEIKKICDKCVYCDEFGIPKMNQENNMKEQVSVDKEEYIKLLRFRTECDFLYKKINYKINELKKEDYLNDSRETQEKISLLESLFK